MGFVPEISVKGLLIDIVRDIHFVYHDIVAGFITTFETRQQIGYIDTVGGNDRTDSRDKTFAIRPFGCDDEGFTSG